MLDVVVVIPNLNGASLLPAGLACLPQAAGECRWQAVVVDNGSTDQSLALLAELFPNVRTIANPENRGFATACNQGGKGLASRHVLFLNSDVTMEAGSLAALVDRMDADPRLGAVSPLMCWPDGRPQGPPIGRRHRWRTDVRMGWLPGTCLLVRRSALDEVDWLDEDFFFYNEDLDLSWRLRRAGWKLACLPWIRVRHHEGTATRSEPAVRARAIAEGFRGSWILARKHYPWAAGGVRLGLLAYVRLRRAWVITKKVTGNPPSDWDRAFLLGYDQALASLADGRA